MFFIFLAFSFLASSLAQGKNYTQTPVQSLTGYKQVQSELIRQISTSSKSFAIGSVHFQDGDLVSALVLASYRNIHVMVFTIENEALDGRSQIQHLRQNNIDVTLLPNEAFQSLGMASFFQTDGKQPLSFNCELIQRSRCPQVSFVTMDHHQEHFWKEKIGFLPKKPVPLAEKKAMPKEDPFKKSGSTPFPKSYRVGYDKKQGSSSSIQRTLPKITLFKKNKMEKNRAQKEYSDSKK